jgi:dephospho-CoA kinase
MKTLGLTGGIGMGKSAAADLLRRRGLPVIDTDDLARQVVEPGQPALAEIQKLFGSDVVGPDGHLRRDELARAVFPSSEKRRQLEAILHPRIRQLWHAQIDAWRAEGRVCSVVVIPLLFETNAQSELDCTVCIACTPVTQAQRLQTRGWSREQIVQRIQAQWPVEQKMSLANYVVWTEGDLEVHAAQLDRILKQFAVG